MEEKKVSEYILINNLIGEGERVGAAVSGGADSMVMLVILKKLGYDVCALHFEHGVRSEEESVGDMLFVKSFCEENGIPFFCERARVPELRQKGESVETAARRLRYGFFERTAKAQRIDKIATAHHADDNAETVIMNLLRGSGTKGMEGIVPKRGIYIRPMLPLSREEIVSYAQNNGIKFVTDCTNLETEYTRNKIRNLVLPVFKEINPSYHRAFLRASELSRQHNGAFEAVVESELSRIKIPAEYGVSLDIAELNKMPEGLALSVIRSAISGICPLKDIEKNHYEAVYALALAANTGKSFSLEGKFTALVCYNRLIIADKLYKIVKREVFPVVPDSVFAVFGGEMEASTVKKAVFGEAGDLTQYFDADKLEGAVVRTRREGDRFSPLGIKGSKKLKDWFIDKKIPAFLRDSIPLVAKDGEILWAVGFAISSKARVTAKTKRIACLTYRQQS